MSVKDHEKLANHISGWLREYALTAGIKGFVLGLSGGVDSALVALLAKQTNLPLFCINMPCHSSSTAYDRAQDFAKDYKLNLLKIDLSQAHEHILNQVPSEFLAIHSGNQKLAEGGLRSCLRSPTLSFFANATKSLILGTGNRSEDNITRYFQKYGDGNVDLSPIGDLFKSEVYELFGYLAHKDYSGELRGMGSLLPYKGVPAAWQNKMPGSARKILRANPTADLWGPDSGQEDEKELGITYDEIEWADRENTRTEKEDFTLKIFGDLIPKGIIFSEDDPAKRPDFYRYTARQKVVICKLHQMEKMTRHKINSNLPVCLVRQEENLVV